MFIDASIFMPAIPLYVQAMPRLCYRCRQQITMKRSDFEWLQTKLSGTVTVDYTTLDKPKEETTAAETPQITRLNDLGVNSLLDMIARDPDMVNRSELDKYRKQNEIKTVQVWQTPRKPTCPVCNGSGQDGFVLCSGFGEINTAALTDPEELRVDQERISSRFWVDVFDKVQNGLVGIDYVAKLAVAAGSQTSPTEPVAEPAPVQIPAPMAGPAITSTPEPMPTAKPAQPFSAPLPPDQPAFPAEPAHLPEPTEPFIPSQPLMSQPAPALPPAAPLQPSPPPLMQPAPLTPPLPPLAAATIGPSVLTDPRANPFATHTVPVMGNGQPFLPPAEPLVIQETIIKPQPSQAKPPEEPHEYPKIRDVKATS